MTTITGDSTDNSFTSTATDETFDLVGGADNQVHFTAGSIGDDTIHLANNPAFGYDITIDLTGVTGTVTGAASLSDPDDLVITVETNFGGGTTTETITLINFFLANSSADQMTVIDENGNPTTFDLHTVFCFAAGTEISTPDGTRCVEHLAIGDRILTAAGRHVAVKWIGRQTVHKLFSGPHMQPVRIRAGALANGLPHSDLTVTADHGMVIDGLVINASALVNGDTIDFVPMDELADSFTVYHIETEDHDVILANGAPSETFVDAVTRRHFDNYPEFLDIHGVERIVREMACPRIVSQRLLPDQIKHRLGIGCDDDAAAASMVA